MMLKMKAPHCPQPKNCAVKREIKQIKRKRIAKKLVNKEMKRMVKAKAHL